MSRTDRAVRPPESPRLEDEPEEFAPGDRHLTGVRVVDADLAGARQAGWRLTDVALERGDLANVVADELSLRRVSFAGVRLTGAAWTRGHLADVAFRDCRIDLATFAATTFERVAFDGCLLGQTDFRDVLLRSVRLDDCDLTGADFAGARVERCELRGCSLDGVSGLERLRGAAMPWADVVGNAGLLAQALGIHVLDDDEPF